MEEQLENQLVKIESQYLACTDTLNQTKTLDLAKPMMFDNLVQAYGEKTDKKTAMLRAEMIKKDFGYMAVNDYYEIIIKGIKGYYDDFKQVPITLRSYYRWLEDEKHKTWSFWKYLVSKHDPELLPIMEKLMTLEELSSIPRFELKYEVNAVINIRERLERRIIRRNQIIVDNFLRPYNLEWFKINDLGSTCSNYITRANAKPTVSDCQWAFIYQKIKPLIESGLKIRTESEINQELENMVEEYKKQFEQVVKTYEEKQREPITTTAA